MFDYDRFLGRSPLERPIKRGASGRSKEMHGEAFRGELLKGDGRSALVMAKLRLLKTGHGDLTLAEWDKDVPETVAAAEFAFAEHFTAGRLAFRLDGPGRTSPIRQFDRTAGEILIVPAIQGGCGPVR
jgi:hypothetical protein